jgi:hypothetical protein
VIVSTLFDRVPAVNLRATSASPAGAGCQRATGHRSPVLLVAALASREIRPRDDARLTVAANEYRRRGKEPDDKSPHYRLEADAIAVDDLL